MRIDPSECAAYLRSGDGYLILSHVRPDGDTIGSGAALCSALRRIGKRAYCYDNPDTKAMLRPFIAPYLAPEGFSPDTVISADVADAGLFPKGFNGEVALAIDHHGSHGEFSRLSCIRPDSSSCGELMLDIIKLLCGDVSREEANLLYVALSTDTGCFQYSNTNAESFKAAAELLELGAESQRLNIYLFRSISRARMQLEGRLMSELHYYRDGKITVNLITRKLMSECGASEDDCEDLAGIAGRVRGSVISVTIRELDEGGCKLSLRSKPGVNVADICAVYGGGGHAMAAGCRLDGDAEAAERAILRAIDEKWQED